MVKYVCQSIDLHSVLSSKSLVWRRFWMNHHVQGWMTIYLSTCFSCKQTWPFLHIDTLYIIYCFFVSLHITVGLSLSLAFLLSYFNFLLPSFQISFFSNGHTVLEWCPYIVLFTSFLISYYLFMLSIFNQFLSYHVQT